VDENMLMASPNLKESLTIKQFLHDFSKASGMCVNEEKSKIFFSPAKPVTPNMYPRVPTKKYSIQLPGSSPHRELPKEKRKNGRTS
jgi:hypothetical protein